MEIFCNICPRKCNKIRNEDIGQGICKMPYLPVISNYSLHKWEEPCISGTNGSGTIFFAGCNLHCMYCQNYKISHDNIGKKISEKELVNIMYELIDSGAHNINLVNPTHYTHILKNVLSNNKFDVPIIYNSSGYDDIDSLKSLEGLIDIYLPDLKYSNLELGIKYSKCGNYFEIATKAIKEMYRQVGSNIYNSEGLIQKGLIVRHLILPNNTNNTIEILKWCKDNLSQDILISIMAQYIPMGKLEEHQEINRKINKIEYNKVVKYMFDNNIDNGYIQDLTSAKQIYIPDFDNENICNI